MESACSVKMKMIGCKFQMWFICCHMEHGDSSRFHCCELDELYQWTIWNLEKVSNNRNGNWLKKFITNIVFMWKLLKYRTSKVMIINEKDISGLLNILADSIHSKGVATFLCQSSSQWWEQLGLETVVLCTFLTIIFNYYLLSYGEAHWL